MPKRSRAPFVFATGRIWGLAILATIGAVVQIRQRWSRSEQQPALLEAIFLCVGAERGHPSRGESPEPYVIIDLGKNESNVQTALEALS